MLKEESYKHFYQVRQFISKYDVTERLRLYNTYSQFKCFEMCQE